MLFLFLLFCFCSAIEFDCPGNPKDQPKDIPQVCQGVDDSLWNPNYPNPFFGNKNYCNCKDNFGSDECAKCDKNFMAFSCKHANVQSYEIVDNECTCKCKADFYGPACDKTECTADYVKDKNGNEINVCDKDGTKSVVVEGNRCKCNCKEGWKGVFCENHDKIKCESQCSKKGTRKIDLKDNVCICHCKPRYFGRGNPNPNPNYPDPDPYPRKRFQPANNADIDCSYHCEKGSYCDDDGTKTAEWEGGVCFCRCAEDYYGPKCDKRCVGWNSGCDEEGTESLYIEGDKCKCKCMEGYYGEKCANQCNNYNGDGLSNCLAEGTESAEINDDKCICKCKKGFYGEKCLKCIKGQNKDNYCKVDGNHHSTGAKAEGGKCICTCDQPAGEDHRYGGDQCEIDCTIKCENGKGKWDENKKECECTCNTVLGYQFFKDINGVCKKKCNKEGAKDITTKCTCGTKCKDRFGGNKCQFDKYTGHSEIMVNAVAGIAIIIIGIWI